MFFFYFFILLKRSFLLLAVVFNSIHRFFAGTSFSFDVSEEVSE